MIFVLTRLASRAFIGWRWGGGALVPTCVMGKRGGGTTAPKKFVSGDLLAFHPRKNTSKKIVN